MLTDVTIAPALGPGVGVGEAADLRAALAAPHALRPGRDAAHAVSNLDFYVRRHRILACEAAVETARTLCQEVGVEPLIEELHGRRRVSAEYVWIGYEIPSGGTCGGGEVVFHAGWLDYCERMGGMLARSLTRRLGGSPYRDALARWLAA